MNLKNNNYFFFFFLKKKKSEILRSDLQNSDAHVLRARILYTEGENAKAALHCQEALRCDPDNSKARILLKVTNDIIFIYLS